MCFYRLLYTAVFFPEKLYLSGHVTVSHSNVQWTYINIVHSIGSSVALYPDV